MKTNFTFYLKSSLMVLFLGLGLSSWGQGLETFDNATALPTGTNYGNGTFVGENGITWSYIHAISSNNSNGNFSIDSSGIILRRSDEPSSISATIQGGIGSFSVDTRKAFTGNTQRKLELVINGTVIEQFQPTFASGTDATIIPFEVEDINIEGEFTLELRMFGATGNQQITLDNIEWTGYIGTPCTPSNLTFTNATVTADLADGNTFTQTATSLNATTAIAYESSDEAVATVNATTGEVSLVGLGTATITATQAAGEHNATEYCAGTATYELTVISTEPVLTVSTNSLSLTGFEGGAATTENITVEGLNLTGDIALALSGDANFSINPTSLSSTGGELTITYTPSATPATHSATLTVSNGLLSEVITLSGVTNEMPEAPAVCGLEDFTNAVDLPTGTIYGGGTFTGNNDIVWNYHGQSAGDYEIDGNGFLLRRASDSYLEVTIPDGVGEFSFDYRKAYTGNSSRQLELLINGVQVATSPTFGATPTGEDSTVYTFTHNVNVEGEVTIRIKLTGDATTNRHTTIDNITWTCYSATPSPVTWTGTAWINGTPSIDEDVVIEGDLFVGTDVASFEAKTLTVASTGSVYIESGNSVTVAGAIDNQAGANNFIVESGANLVQTDDVDNTGDITVEVKAMTEWFGYNMFSSPVAGQTFAGFSPDNGDEVYTYNFTDDTDHGYDTASGTVFQEGLGYLFAAPYNGFPQGVLTEFTGEFVGVPHNGTVSIPVGYSFTALGNPYPSAIDAQDFLAANSNVGTLYFWTNAHFYNSVSENYEGNNYATFTSLTGTGTAGFPVSDNLTIEAGQGFLASVNAGNVVFDNAMRVGLSNGQFYKTMEQEKHILWLNLANENNMLNQIAIGYADGATEGVDAQIDGKMFGYAGSALYSIITGEQDAYAIQGRSLPFTNTDAVALGFRAAQAGTYTVSLADFNGLFANGQDIYLKDNATQTYHDLKDGAYTFVSEQGVFESRFEVVYQADGELSTNVPTLDNSWIVYSQDNGLQIEAQGFELKEVSVYDMLGRLIYTNQATGTSHAISNIANGVLIVKVITTDNQVLTRKTAK